MTDDLKENQIRFSIEFGASKISREFDVVNRPIPLDEIMADKFLVELMLGTPARIMGNKIDEIARSKKRGATK